MNRNFNQIRRQFELCYRRAATETKILAIKLGGCRATLYALIEAGESCWILAPVDAKPSPTLRQATRI